MTDIDTARIRAHKLDLAERLADDLAHEIKNPLHSMAINLEVLRRGITRSSGTGIDNLLRHVGVVSEELDRLNRRIDFLLRLVRPGHDDEPISLSEALDETIELAELERKDVTIDRRPATAPSRARLPRETARQLLLELFLAALDATPRGGTILVSLESSNDAERVRFEAAPPSTAPPGRDADSAPGGTPDLAMARSLAGSLDGCVDVILSADSTRPGTAFSLSLPPSRRLRSSGGG